MKEEEKVFSMTKKIIRVYLPKWKISDTKIKELAKQIEQILKFQNITNEQEQKTIIKNYLKQCL